MGIRFFGRRRACLGAAGAALALGAVMSESAVALPAECVETGPTTVKCSYDVFSANHEFVVPAGVASIRARAVGAPGQSTNTPIGFPALGGRGAIVTADLPVAPGSTLTAFPAHKTSPDRGFGACVSGGGASGLRTGPLLADRILVAGGGGGAGCGSAGGAGGDAGSGGGAGGFGAGGGGAATQTSGGAGGASLSPAAPGSSGSFGQGASGAAASGVADSSGGGGGGGWYGGGGGGAGAFGGGGGGGGSSLVPAGGTLALHDARLDPGIVHPSSAVVEIEYSTVPLPTITFSSGDPASGMVGQPYSHTFAATGDEGISFDVASGTTPPGLTLAPSGALTGTPTEAGSFPFKVRATGDSGATAEKDVTVTIAATAPGASVSPASVDFGTQAVGSPSAPQTVTLSSTGTAPLVVSDVTVAGPDASDFAIVADDCAGATLAPSESCDVSVRFTPSAVGSRAATLRFADNAADSPQTAALSGSGRALVADLAASLTATPNPVKVGATLTYSMTVRNDGPESAEQVKLTDTLPAAAQFSSLTAPAGWTCTTPPVGDTGSIVCTRAALASGASSTLTLKVKVVSSGKATVSNTIKVSSSSSDPNLENNDATATTSVQGRR